MKRSAYVAFLIVGFTLVHSVAGTVKEGPKQLCRCANRDAPVCGINKKTYGNACLASCDEVDIECEQACPCPDFCACPAVFAPVCGADGETYSNAACAKCAKVEVVSEGACSPGLAACTCIALADPVCGVDGQDYGNECLAGCENVKVDCKGPCPCPTEEPCICTREYAPVCGVDEETYGNECEAGCAGVDIACKGECPCTHKETCGCTLEYAPVCGVDGRDYGNACGARCHNIEVACEGECPCPTKEPCVCTKEYAPVCGVDEETYGNKCLAGCKDVEIACKGECPCKTKEPCICTKEYAPVCLTTGVTLGNKCEAACDNSEIACGGECPCKPPMEPCEEPIRQCLVNACQFATCPAHPEAKCYASCGGCTANWFVGKTPVDCDETDPCICTEQYEPVCGVDERTYSNACFAECEDVKIECEGECPCEKPCIGPLIKCGADPCDSASCAFYPQAECVANYCHGCSDVDFFVDGKKVDCGEPCACPAFISPVCGANGQTYGNSCQAKCAGVDILCERSCPCTPKCDKHDIANCLVDPCQVTKCPAFPEAECVSNYCGGCNADFYLNGVLVDCNGPPTCTPEGEACSYIPFRRKGGCCEGTRCCYCKSTKGKKGDGKRHSRRCAKNCFHC